MAFFNPKRDPVVPYKNGSSLLSNWLIGASYEAKLWRRACAVLSFVLCFSVAGLTIQSRRYPAVYVVEVNEHGAVKLTGKIEEHSYQPKAEVIKYFLSEFVNDIRTIPMDPIVLKENFLNAYQLVTAKGRTVLNAYSKEYGPFEKLKRRVAVFVTISSIIKRSGSTYQVTWAEERFENGTKISNERFSGLFTVVIQEPRDEKTITKNPLGIWIDFFNLSKEFS